jgi:hypothetical protein
MITLERNFWYSHLGQNIENTFHFGNINMVFILKVFLSKVGHFNLYRFSMQRPPNSLRENIQHH